MFPVFYFESGKKKNLDQEAISCLFEKGQHTPLAEGGQEKQDSRVVGSGTEEGTKDSDNSLDSSLASMRGRKVEELKISAWRVLPLPFCSVNP